MAPTEMLPVALPTLELPTEDGISLESGWHRAEINLQIESLRHHWRDRTDFYCGGNMFVYTGKWSRFVEGLIALGPSPCSGSGGSR